MSGIAQRSGSSWFTSVPKTSVFGTPEIERRGPWKQSFVAVSPRGFLEYLQRPSDYADAGTFARFGASEEQ